MLLDCMQVCGDVAFYGISSSMWSQLGILTQYRITNGVNYIAFSRIVVSYLA
jgi:hypothetical protein